MEYLYGNSIYGIYSIYGNSNIHMKNSSCNSILEINLGRKEQGELSNIELLNYFCIWHISMSIHLFQIKLK